MNLEIIKLRKHTIDGSENWVMAEEDFIRLISKHKLTLSDLLKAGISRSIWDNTLICYGYDVNSIQGLRERPYKESHHGNSTFGFSTKISSREGNYANDSKISNYVSFIEKYFQGFTQLYSSYREDPEGVTKIIGEYNKELLELGLSLRYIHSRVRKWAVKVGKPYQKIIHSKLNIAFSKLLDELGVSYLVEYRVYNYFFDFYLPDHKILIEIDGGGHTGDNDLAKEKIIKAPDKLLRFKIRDRQQLAKKYDTIKNTIIQECGIKNNM